ncbi:uncharacterized protein DEA37_0011862 [Paragonimus westermani]|uniref:Uncharacterized protein n=1 Tax=Paragonimus westermani TaxID=34504 RepID=A0A5J4NMH6_9TREM|nr:uncharacterized protein DEA37_0011862 [Paragonimus westermani]
MLCKEDSNDLVFQGHTDAVTRAKWMNNGLYVVSVSYDRTVRIWDSQTSEQRAHIRPHEANITAAAISLDDQK